MSANILIILIPGINFTDILRVAFSNKRVFYSFSVLTIWVCNFWEKRKQHKSWQKKYWWNWLLRKTKNAFGRVGEQIIMSNKQTQFFDEKIKQYSDTIKLCCNNDHSHNELLSHDYNEQPFFIFCPKYLP